jgi:hypothetical protein
MNSVGHNLPRKSTILLIYGLAFVALFPLIQFEYFKSTLSHENPYGFWFTFRVVFSGPILLIIGPILLLKYKNYIHKIFGCISVIGGLYWGVKLYEALASF